MHTSQIEDHMIPFPHCIHLTTSVTEALNIMNKYHLRHLPVMHKQKLVGVVSERDLLGAERGPDQAILLVKDVMVKDPYVVHSGTPLTMVTQTMANKKYGCALVHDGQQNIVGIFTVTDGMRLLSWLLRNPGFIHRVPKVQDAIEYELVAAMSG